MEDIGREDIKSISRVKVSRVVLPRSSDLPGGID